jgi:hypothetical protein
MALPWLDGFWDADLPAMELIALQLAGWIDLHRSEEDFCYRVPSHREQAVNLLAAGCELS